MNLTTAEIQWHPGWRIIPSRFPPIQLFELVTDVQRLEATIALESETNPRLKNEVGDLSLVPQNDRVVGPGSSIIMAAFTHLNPEGSRFSDGSYGVFYVAKSLDTAIAETKYHREQFFKETHEPQMKIDMRVYRADIEGKFHDIRNNFEQYTDLYHHNDYSHSRPFAKKLRDERSNGIVYNSVRDEKGQCIAVFRPTKISRVIQERHLSYEWDGERISRIVKIDGT